MQRYKYKTLFAFVPLVGIGVALYAAGAQPEQKEAKTVASPLANAARAAYEAHEAARRRGTGGDEDVYQWSRRWMEAAQASGNRERAAAEHLDRMSSLLQEVEARAEIGAHGGSPEAVAAARYYQLEAQQLAGR